MNNRCPLCKSIEVQTLYKGNKRLKPDEDYFICTTSKFIFSKTVMKCLRCGVFYLSPFPDREFSKRMYRNSIDIEYLKEEKPRREFSEKDLMRIMKLTQVKNGRILDIGCSVGLFLDIARKFGFQVEGIEASSWAVRKAKEKFNLDLINDDIENIHILSERYDIIVMHSIIEHLYNPISALQKCFNALKKGGVLFLVTPNPASFFSKILRAHWWSYREAHLFLFPPKTLKNTLSKIGFSLKHLCPYSRTFTISYWVEKITGCYKPLGIILKKLSKIVRIYDRELTLNLKDEISLVAIKGLDKQEISPKSRRKKVIVVMPAYNAEKTLSKTYKDIPKEFVDEIILVDDASKDNTVNIAKKLGIKTIVHKNNLGYGANQKTCYKQALNHNADIIVMVHPDYQYDPTLLPKIIEPIEKNEADVVLGSRMLKKGGALKGGMPLYKYSGNKILTAVENLVLFLNLSEYHTGYRAFSSKVLQKVPFLSNSDKFVFDTEIIIQIRVAGFRIKEIPIPTRYFKEASSVDFRSSILYGLRILFRLTQFLIWKNFSIRLFKFKEFPEKKKKGSKGKERNKNVSLILH